ncbi:MAG: ATP synthase F1 subunit gamma [Candidatus Lloydbacteria bacterium RIFCSPHIGHO2_02_FULL_54_17]|uniref:ATP synthase F1 subunit gamma n=1 Tax=Candidatus Lloydbacteria bacterium RIFCSPHIGHO2_02_FULL_54_17 TaxID=1798664 RepID=A0A1G2DE73_9BACT|nr:MAG: ATP synthase F1 subunit gamma [Candidatus Lloydbacteria bacterium RIFCSPHIGHO2_01_FULL_54_11]OGZ11947.1 MAG: ATP synthase F1 subunit gamma [Candidatus Lloydbacteria bacterium RIFCSPHIGHO2_02_FULL_54_17]OGZ14201.1 MAG: ATP synthase F1 subunit gamma [Candidatus Lloydbacteria bacterium RIFCSPLOWO2_01_FULL_54_18]
MEAVSAVKMRKSQQNAIGIRPYALSALKILRSISGSIEAANHPLTKARKVEKTLIVLVSADKGLAGSYGAALLKGAYRFIEEKGLTKENTALIAIGKRGYEHFAKRGWTIVNNFERWSDQVSFDTVRPLAEEIKSLYMDGTYDEILIVYTNFISTLKQVVYSRKLLPVTFESVEEVVRGITPERGKFAEIGRDIDAAPVKEYTFEPEAGEILSELIPILFNIQIYHSVLEANASEHSARMLAMKNASDNAKDISRELKLYFNKVRQAAITREVSEIVGGMESMKVRE